MAGDKLLGMVAAPPIDDLASLIVIETRSRCDVERVDLITQSFVIVDGLNAAERCSIPTTHCNCDLIDWREMMTDADVSLPIVVVLNADPADMQTKRLADYYMASFVKGGTASC
jgi:hypothetical protein